MENIIQSQDGGMQSPQLQAQAAQQQQAAFGAAMLEHAAMFAAQQAQQQQQQLSPNGGPDNDNIPGRDMTSRCGPRVSEQREFAHQPKVQR